MQMIYPVTGNQPAHIETSTAVLVVWHRHPARHDVRQICRADSYVEVYVGVEVLKSPVDLKTEAISYLPTACPLGHSARCPSLLDFANKHRGLSSPYTSVLMLCFNCSVSDIPS